ncbi:hypothetical protein HNR16_000181 [Pseudoclavibacter chungangensis]|uniref:hypothetical protein n=1 Tax=Pseudoclavibacter chungangensis TaxID=587635 RepID=UPI001856EB0B|nr:hypothetical protein [Pseudoclavibacter chungangensis]NYJ65393.1 hypothetical protein [Pseudoclavibacter chungangensis]
MTTAERPAPDPRTSADAERDRPRATPPVTGAVWLPDAAPAKQRQIAGAAVRALIASPATRVATTAVAPASADDLPRPADPVVVDEALEARVLGLIDAESVTELTERLVRTGGEN